MICELSNGIIDIKVSTLGAELMSARKNGCEYIWQGDPAYWASRSPLMFPICGRLPDGKFSYGGKEYSMTHHGFTRNSEFRLSAKTDSSLEFTLVSDDTTRSCYPFDFEFKVTYTLQGSSLLLSADIKNTGSSVMPAAFGAHPGFNVPLDNGNFEDWYIEFSEDTTPNLFIFSESLLDSGKRVAYPLKDGKILPLSHALFAIDGVFMSHIPSRATLKSDKSSRSVTLSYPQMPYMGVWHKPQSDAPYVCIEPWCGLPSIDGMDNDIMKKSDMFHIAPNSKKSVSLSFDFN